MNRDFVSSLHRFFWIAAFVLLLCAVNVASGQGSPVGMEVFEKEIRPILIEHCIRCHGPDKQRGGLRLDFKSGWVHGGDSGPAVTPGDPQSLLLRAIRYEDPNLEMPPKGKLPDADIEHFEQWVALGAVDPRSENPADHPKADLPEADRPETDQASTMVAAGRDFWAFQPRRAVVPPDVRHAEWPANAIDRFILAELEREGLEPQGPADSLTLLRRVYFDLTGLPPTPREIEDFLEDESNEAWTKVVDRLLASPQFGQRWGRHWLDVVRFAESSGGGRTLLFPDAWRFRDYVIESFNEDVPYDRFLMEQIAGDLLPWNDWQERQRNLVATGFLLLGPTNYEMQDKDILEMDVVDEQLDTIGKALLGMTIGCARCHDHKFDPIPAADYYAMAGIFKSTQSLIHSNVSAWNSVGLPLPEEDELRLAAHESAVKKVQEELQQATRLWRQAGGDAKKEDPKSSIQASEIKAIVLDDSGAKRMGAWTESTAISGFVGDHYLHDASEHKGEKQVVYEHRLDAAVQHQAMVQYEVLVSYTPGSNRSRRVPVHVFHRDGESVVHIDQRKAPPNDGRFASLGTFAFDPTSPVRVVISNDQTADGVVVADAVLLADPQRSAASLVTVAGPQGKDSTADASTKRRVRELKERVDELTGQLKQLQETGPSRPVCMAVQDCSETGDLPLAIRGVVGQSGPVVPRGVMQVASWESFPPLASGQSGRREFATWITDQRHPLTARVMANRVWYWMMGQGLVRTVDNFGSTGEPPTHPELLDYLAETFVQEGWSVKKLVRRIALSRVYQLSSQSGSHAERDPANRKYWRMNRKRLHAEDIRDSILLVAGSLDQTFAGATIKPGTKIEYGYQFDSLRRSVYLPVFRNTLPQIFEVFDFADPNVQRGARSASTIASQALWMMNHPEILNHSRKAAEQLLGEPELSQLQRIRHAYLQVLGRQPTDPERQIAYELVNPEDGSDEVAQNSSMENWAMLYQTLFQCIDFRYLN